jgi:predicted Zn-dependent peptidase
MRAIFFSFLLLSFLAKAQETKPYEMMINGVKVVVVPSGNEIVQVDLMIKGGVQNYTKEQAGIEKMAMTALAECGTLKRDKNSFKNALDEVDAQVYGFAGRDAAHMVLNCIKGDFETVWPLYVEALTMPKFDAKEFARIKEEAITQLREQEGNPDASLQKLAMQTAFKGMDYEKWPSGSLESLQKLTPAATKAYLSTALTRSKIFIVVVGDVTKEDVQQKMTALLSKIPKGKPFMLKRDAYVPKENSFASQEREVATNYIMGMSSAPASNSKEYYPATLASRLFYQKAFLEVRTKQGLSYAPAAYISQGLTPFSAMYVTTKEPDKYIAVVRNMVDKIKTEGFPEDDIKDVKTTYATAQYYNSETNGALAGMVCNMELLQGDWRKAFTLKEDFKAVPAEEVNRVFNKYIGKFTWIYQGDPKVVNKTLFTQPQTPPVPEVKKAF